MSMPALSPTMTEGKIAKWNFKEGDAVEVGDVVADIETDKSSVGYEVQEEGYLAKIFINEGGSAAIGDPLFVIVQEKDDVAAFKDYSPDSNSGSKAEEEAPVAEDKPKKAKKVK